MARKIQRFNKKTFDPSWSNRDHRKILDMWRNAGWSRSCAYREYRDIKQGYTNFAGKKLTIENTFYRKERLQLEKLRSTAYQAVLKYAWPDGKKNWFVVDAGCGKSPDSRIAVEEDGCKGGVRVDLFDVPWDYPKIEVVYGDISEKLPIKNGSVDLVICQAVLDLLDGTQRDAFYKNAHKWLKKDGILSVYIVNLVLGHGFNLPDERDAAEAAGFRLLKGYAAGFVMQKI